jgi:hypothetical protein
MLFLRSTRMSARSWLRFKALGDYWVDLACKIGVSDEILIADRGESLYEVIHSVQGGSPKGGPKRVSGCEGVCRSLDDACSSSHT